MRPSSRRPRDDARVVHIMRMLERANVECEVELPWGQVVHVRKRDEHGVPKGCPVQFRLILRNDRPLRQAVTELSLGRAYVQGDLDIEVAGEDEPLHADGKLSPQEVKENRERLAGNAEAVFDVRDELRSGMSPADLLRLASGFAFASPTRANDRAIRHHYSLGDDFYHSFLDTEYHFYSQCLFRSDDDDLETAAGHKLADMYQRLGLEAGDRILDIGSGWGGLTKYCRALDLDVRVTSLTLSEDSARYIREQVGGEEVLIEDLLEHRRRGYYSHAVIFGVIEHIPTYRQFCARVWDALEPEGRLYLDASATREKYAGSAFTRRYIWRGPHACLAIQDMIEELLFHGFDLLHVRQANDDYSRTMREWALRLELNHALIAERWGEHVYRTFRVFLWGGAHAFSSDRLQAYTLVAERRKEPGPRPGYLRRAGHFVAAMR